jgi:hypothetical protein
MGMGINDMSVHKRTLALFLVALMVATVFGVMGTAVATPRDVANVNYAKNTVIAHPNVIKNDAFVHPNATNASGGQCIFLKKTLRVEQASMISPKELGIGVSVMYPVCVHTDVPRYITVTAAINGKPGKKRLMSPSIQPPAYDGGKHLVQKTKCLTLKAPLNRPHH